MPTTEWRRSVFADDSNSLGYGSFEAVTLAPGETCIRLFWGCQFVNVSGSLNSYPPGTTITKAGIVYEASGQTIDQTSTPLSQPDADWMDIRFMPWTGNIATSTNVDWLLTAVVAEQDVKSQRKNPIDATAPMGIYGSWETGHGTTPATFQYSDAFVVDALILNPQT